MERIDRLKQREARETCWQPDGPGGRPRPNGRFRSLRAAPGAEWSPNHATRPANPGNRTGQEPAIAPEWSAWRVYKRHPRTLPLLAGYARRGLCRDCPRRRTAVPANPNPAIIIAQAEGSGTAAGASKP